MQSSRALIEQGAGTEYVGEFEAVELEEEPCQEPEKPSDAGAISAVLLALFSLLRALDLAWQYGFKLRFASGSRVLDLRWPVAAYCLIALALLACAGRFTRWFAPPGRWRIPRLALASLGIMIALYSLVPLTMRFEGFAPTGQLGNPLTPMMESGQASFFPMLIGFLLVLAACLPAIVASLPSLVKRAPELWEELNRPRGR